MCNCNAFNHQVETVTVTETNVALSVTKSTNISSLEYFNLVMPGCVRNRITGSPLPVQVVVNGTAVSLYNKYSLPVLSNKIPRFSFGAYVAEGTATPYVILFDTPKCKCNA